MVVLIIILCVILIIGVTVFIGIQSYKKKAEHSRIMEVGYDVLKNDALDFALKNNGSEKFRMDQKILLRLRSTQMDLDAVFNPEKKIVIGRKKECGVCIHSKGISGKHCEIQYVNGKIIVRDLNSTNGTMLVNKKGKFRVTSNPGEVLMNGDVIIVDGISIQVESFFLDKEFFRKKTK